MRKNAAENKSYLNTTLPRDLIKSLKVLAAEEGVRINNLLEEAIRDILKKYSTKV